jgi:sodium/potassium-transporting ATPase subunit alpha
MKNTMLNGALLFETILAIILIYTPTIPQFIGLYPLNPQWWIPALPFSLLIWAMDEFRRFLLRRNKTHPSGLTQFIENETYY